jgi:coenzyme F420-reducing hydrogenase delta subunit
MVEALHALEDGADGVMVLGCMEGDCHFLQGNLRARRRVARVKKTIAEAGLEPERIEKTAVIMTVVDGRVVYESP